MKRQDYINELKQQLQGLPQSEIADIVRDQEELISDALAAGRTEESILKSLGDPSELARALKAEVIIEQASEEKKLGRQLKGAFGAVGALLLLAPFNLIFVLGPFMVLLGMLFSGWMVATALGGVAVFLAGGYLSELITVSASVWVHLSLVFTLIAGVGISILALLAMYYITRGMMQLTLSYLKWNLNFVRRRVKGNI